MWENVPSEIIKYPQLKANVNVVFNVKPLESFKIEYCKEKKREKGKYV